MTKSYPRSVREGDPLGLPPVISSWVRRSFPESSPDHLLKVPHRADLLVLRKTSSNSLDAGRFTAGTVLASLAGKPLFGGGLLWRRDEPRTAGGQRRLTGTQG